MSTPDKRARENKKARKKREKEQRRWEKRMQGTGEVEVVSQAEVVGDLRSIEEVMADLADGGPTASREAVTVPTKLFVGGLSYDTTSAGLRAAFEKFGPVDDAAVIKDRDTGQSRGFGFVTMTDRKDAPKAIQALDGEELDGRRIAVNVATDRR